MAGDLEVAAVVDGHGDHLVRVRVRFRVSGRGRVRVRTS